MSENKNLLPLLALVGLGILILKPKEDENGNGDNSVDGAKGHVTLEVIPVGAITHSSPEAYASVILKVTGLATHGIPAPNMELSLSIDGSLLPGEMKVMYYSVELAKEYYLEVPYDKAGKHTAYAFLRLSNAYGVYPLKGGVVGFDIGEAPLGHVTLGY